MKTRQLFRTSSMVLLSIASLTSTAAAQELKADIVIQEESFDEYGAKTEAMLTFWPENHELGSFFLLETGGNRVDLRGSNPNSQYLTNPYLDTSVWIECLMENGNTKRVTSGDFLNILIGAGVFGRDKELKAVKRSINTLLSAKKFRVTIRLHNHPDWNTSFEMQLTAEQKQIVLDWMGYGDSE